MRRRRCRPKMRRLPAATSALQAAVTEAAATLTASEAALATLTAERAEAAAARHQFERLLREGVDRRDRLARQIADVGREADEIAASHRRACRSPGKAGTGRGCGSRWWRPPNRRRLPPKRPLPCCARTRPRCARPLQEAKAELARVETEARTLAKILNAGDRRPVPGGAGADQGRARLRDGAGCRPRRRSRRSARSGRAGPLGRQRAAAGRSGSAAGGPAAGQRRAGAAAACAPPGADRHRRSRPTPSGCPKCWRPASAWSAATARCGAGTGWWRAPTRRPRPRSAWRRRTGSPSSTPKRLPRPPGLRAAEQALAGAERALREGTEAERAARQGWRDAQHQLDAARDALQKAEKAAGELTARRAALAESLSRLNEAHAEASGAVTEAERGLDAAPDLSELQAAFDRLAADVQRDRATLADARARHDGLKREAEQRARRLAAIAAERDQLDFAGRERRSPDRRARRAAQRCAQPSTQRWKARPTRSTSAAAR